MNCLAWISMYALTACGGSQKAPTLDTSSGGAGTGAAAPACVDEGSGRDFGAAKPLAAGSFDGCTGTDPDVYSVLAPDHAAGTLYQLTVGASGGDVIATIFDQDQHELGTATVAKGQETSMYIVVATNSRMFVRAVGTSQTVQPYKLTTKATPLTDEDEPNNSAEEARPLNLGQARTALLQTAANAAHGSADYYRVLVGRDGTLKVDVEPGTDEVTLAAEITDRTGKKVADATAANAGASIALSARVKRGDFVIKVWASEEAATRSFSAGTAPRYLQDGYRITATRK
jgi:hypothetical protein